jgi:hypothetical protein
VPLREAATLFFVHECSHQDIATFLGLSVTTVNNRLHAARAQLKRRRLITVKDTLEAYALPDEFANRIGRLVTARGGVIEALFDPAAQPDILAELAVSDEAHRAPSFRRKSGHCWHCGSTPGKKVSGMSRWSGTTPARAWSLAAQRASHRAAHSTATPFLRLAPYQGVHGAAAGGHGGAWRGQADRPGGEISAR